MPFFLAAELLGPKITFTHLTRKLKIRFWWNFPQHFSTLIRPTIFYFNVMGVKLDELWSFFTFSSIESPMQYFDRNHVKHALAYTSWSNICKMVRRSYMFGVGFGSLKITFFKMVIAVNRMKIGKSIIFFQDWVHSVIFNHSAKHEDCGVINGWDMIILKNFIRVCTMIVKWSFFSVGCTP